MLEGGHAEGSGYVFDFGTLKKIMRRLWDEIDHKILFPLENPRLQVVEAGDAVTVAYDHKPRYLFPRGDCALLPIPNTTVEMLAELLAGRLRAELESVGAAGVATIEIEVEENFGQSAVYRVALR